MTPLHRALRAFSTLVASAESDGLIHFVRSRARSLRHCPAKSLARGLDLRFGWRSASAVSETGRPVHTEPDLPAQKARERLAPTKPCLSTWCVAARICSATVNLRGRPLREARALLRRHNDLVFSRLVANYDELSCDARSEWAGPRVGAARFAVLCGLRHTEAE
jgi:hypothetical protein